MSRDEVEHIIGHRKAAVRRARSGGRDTNPNATENLKPKMPGASKAQMRAALRRKMQAQAPTSPHFTRPA